MPQPCLPVGMVGGFFPLVLSLSKDARHHY